LFKDVTVWSWPADGIGLYLVEEIPGYHSSKIEVISEEGVGSTFYFAPDIYDHANPAGSVHAGSEANNQAIALSAVSSVPLTSKIIVLPLNAPCSAHYPPRRYRASAAY